MTQKLFHFKPDVKDSTLLPEWARKGAILLWWMEKLGIVDMICKLLRFPRRHGLYHPIDFFWFAVLAFSAEEYRSFHAFFEACKPYRKLLAAAFGRKSFPDQSTACRFYRAVPLEVAIKVVEELILRTVTPFSEIWRKWCGIRDRLGQNWLVIDFDYQHLGIRLRALPKGEEFPPPIRMSDESARPGHTGHHRGELVQQHGKAMFRGSAQCLELLVEAGNPSMSEGISSVLEKIKALCERDDLDPGKMILVIDGEASSRRCLQLLAGSPVNFITRSDHYSLLDDPVLREKLNKGEWYKVRDSGSGPTRYAIDIGDLEVEVEDESGHSRKVAVRLVVSRFKPESLKPGPGRMLGDYQWEMFATKLRREAFGPEDVVRLYMGRASVENQYACNDRELYLDHLYCQRVGGQHLIQGIALAVWNLSILLGYRQEPPNGPLPRQLPDCAEPVRPQQPLFPPFSGSEESAEAAGEDIAARPDQKVAELPDQQPLKGSAAAQAKALEIDWSRRPRFQPGSFFVWDEECKALICKAGNKLKPMNLRYRKKNGNLYIRFVAPPDTCWNCPFLSRCSNSRSPTFRREVWVMAADQPSKAGKVLFSPTGHQRPLGFSHSVGPSRAGPWKMASSSLFPATYRRRFATLCRNTAIWIVIGNSDPPVPTADDIDRRRAHRRLTWKERLEKNALPGPVHVDISNPFLLSILS